MSLFRYTWLVILDRVWPGDHHAPQDCFIIDRMTPSPVTPAANERKKATTSNSPAKRTRSQSVGGKQSLLEQKCAPTRPTKTQLTKCPCLMSNEKQWKIKCCYCRQVWHTSCCNLVAKTLTGKTLIELEQNWACPWCYVAPFLRPLNHPSLQS